MKKVKIIPLFQSLGVCLLAGFVGSLFTFESIPTWYATLNKPFFNPPNWIFGPVWTLLYIMMGVSLYLVWTANTKKAEKQQGMKNFIIQLALNAIWSIVFFGMHSPFLALLVIVVLWIMIFQTIKYFRQISKTAAWLLIPYLAWVSFASLLNLSIMLLNR